MARILMVYGTTQGQTGKIAFRIRDELLQAGHSVDLFDSSKISSSISTMKYEAVIIGASIHAGGYQRSLKRWVMANAQTLNCLPSAFFSVCLGVLQREISVQQDLARISEDFLKVSGWRPTKRVIFAGALSYSKYNSLLKWWMNRISKKAGGDTDTSKDYEYTDWNAVSRFTQEFSNDFQSTFSIHCSREFGVP